jgi:hypothetical protein
LSVGRGRIPHYTQEGLSRPGDRTSWCCMYRKRHEVPIAGTPASGKRCTGQAYAVTSMRCSSFRCSRCQKWYFAKWGYHNGFARKCAHCGLLKYAPPHAQNTLKAPAARPVTVEKSPFHSLDGGRGCATYIPGLFFVPYAKSQTMCSAT